MEISQLTVQPFCSLIRYLKKESPLPYPAIPDDQWSLIPDQHLNLKQRQGNGLETCGLLPSVPVK